MAIRAAELRVIIGADTSGVEQGFSATSNWLRRLAGDNQTFRGAFAGVFAGGLMTQAIGNMRGLGDEALDAYASNERLGMSLQNLVAKEYLTQGSAKSMAEALRLSSTRAQELVGWTQKLAIDSPFTQQGVADAFRTAMAYGFTTKETQRLTQAMIDFSAGSGAGEDTMGRIALALGQIQARGKLAGQEVMQLTEAGISVDRILAEAFGKSTNEIIEMREKGLIPAEAAIKAITVALERDFGGAAKRQAGTFAGMLNSLEDIKQIGLREFFGETFRMIQPDLEKFIATLQKAETIEKIREAGRDLATFLRDAGKAAGEAIQWFEGLNETNQKLLLGLGGLVLLRGPVFGLLANGASLAGGMMKTVGGLSEAWRAWNAGMTLTTSLQAGLGALPVTLGSIALGVGSIVAVWATWNQQIVETNRRGLEQTGSAWDDFFRQQAEGGAGLEKTTDAFVNSYQGIRNTIKSSGFAGLFVNQTEMAKQAMTKFEEVARSGAGSYQEYVEAMIDAGIATGALHESYRNNTDAWETSASALGYLNEQLGVASEREFFLAQNTEERYARDEENHFRTLTSAEERFAATQLEIEQQAILQAQREAAEAAYQAQLESGRGMLESYRESVRMVQEAERSWLDQTGSQLVEYLGQRLPEGSQRWREGMVVIDEVMGTSELKAYDTQKAYEDLMKQFQSTGDVEGLKSGLMALRDEGLETVRSKMQETIDKAQELYTKLMGLPEKIRIDIEFYGELPSWLDGIPQPTGRNPRVERDAIGGVGYPGDAVWVGERGPELFRPFSAGVIEPTHKSQAGSGSPTFNFYPKEVLDLEETAWKIFNYLQGQMA